MVALQQVELLPDHTQRSPGQSKEGKGQHTESLGLAASVIANHIAEDNYFPVGESWEEAPPGEPATTTAFSRLWCNCLTRAGSSTGVIVYTDPHPLGALSTWYLTELHRLAILWGPRAWKSRRNTTADHLHVGHGPAYGILQHVASVP